MLKAIFSKTTLALLVVLFMVMWLGGGVLNQFIHLPGTQTQSETAPALDPALAAAKADPAVVTAITRLLQPIADQLSRSMDAWWAQQKVNFARQASQWLSQQEQLLLDVLKVKLQEWVDQTLGVSTASAQ